MIIRVSGMMTGAVKGQGEMDKPIYLYEDYIYIYETHMHTSESSKCASSSGKEMADAYFDAGYSGIFVTDHFIWGNTRVDPKLPWEDWVTEFIKGYEHAKAEGDAIGLQVFFGWEACYKGIEFLIYGLSPEWLYKHPEIRDATIPEQLELVHAGGGMVIQAHPYRKEDYIPEMRLYPDHVDGVEVINATHSSHRSKSHNNPLFNLKAEAYAKHYNLPMTAGSDNHTTDLFYGGMGFDHKLETPQDFIKAVKNREGVLLGEYGSCGWR